MLRCMKLLEQHPWLGTQVMATVTVHVAGTRPFGTATWAPSVAASCASIMTEVPSRRPARTDNKAATTLEEPVHRSVPGRTHTCF